MAQLDQFKLFDSHLHIIDPRFPLIENQGYLPEQFQADDYRRVMQNYNVAGGAVVSGSFQAFDQSYLLAALEQLGPNFVGVTQLPEGVSDEELITLNQAGVRALRFNLKRGGSQTIETLKSFASRVYEVVGWHVELYVDARELESLSQTLMALPRVSIDHLGLSAAGFPALLTLVERGIFVKATGFGRVDFDVSHAMQQICHINPNALVFGSDLPSTRAPRPYCDTDFIRVIDALGEEQAEKVFYQNALTLYDLNQ